MYTNSEFYEMVRCYITSGETLRAAQRMYIEESVPRLANAGIINPRVPNLRTILAANMRLLEFGQFTVPAHAEHRGRPHMVTDEPAPRKPRLEVKDEKKQVGPHHKEIIEEGNKEQTKISNLRKYNPTPGISDDGAESDLDLYADHEIKEEMVIDVPAPKNPRLEVKDEKKQVEPHQKEIIEENTVEIVSNVIKKERKKVGNKEQTKFSNLRKYNPTPGILDDGAESDLDLYADHEIKKEMVIGPVVLQRVVNATNYCEDVPASEKPRLEIKDEKAEQVEQEIIEDNTVEVVSNVMNKKRKKVRNKEQTKCDNDLTAPKNPRLEGNEKKTDQVKSPKRNSTEVIKSKIKKKGINKEQKKCYNLRKYNQTSGISRNVFICNDCGNKYRKKCKLAEHIVCHEKIKQDNNYRCKEYTYQTGSQDSLEQHYKLHDKHRNFICDLCGYRSDKKYKLLKHLKSKHSLLNEDSKEKAFLCSVCGYRCKHNSALLIHLRRHNGEKPYSCSECEFKFASKGNMKTHLRIHTKPYSCSECEFKCTGKGNLKTHLTIHAEEKTYSCSECEFKCASKGNMKTHLRIHTKPYSCSECEFKCTGKCNLKTHLTIHAEEKTYSCSECEYKSGNKGNLKKHLCIHTKPHSCTECKYKCASKKDLTIHLRTHTGEKPFTCAECGFKCSNKSYLRTHLRTHLSRHTCEKAKPKRFSCSQCEHKFALKCNLITHLRTHTGEKAYSCSKCEYKCKSRLGLLSHVYIHAGEKPYACSECDYKCVSKSYLTKHFRIHTGEKPFACSECEYKCISKSHLTKHSLTHTGVKPYSCSECEYKFKSKSTLTRHLHTYNHCDI